MNETDDAFDLILLLAVLAIFAPILVHYTVPFFKGEVGGFGVQIEKSALATESELVPSKDIVTTDDVIGMLLMADAYSPMPQKVKIVNGGNEKVFEIDSYFSNNRVKVVQDAQTYLPSDKEVELTLHTGLAGAGDVSGLSGMEYWEVRVMP